MKIDCQTAQELIPGFTLGALEPDEQVALLDHLHGCVSCRAEADSLQPVFGLLGLAAPDAGEPAPQVKRQIMAKIGDGTRPRTVPQPRRRWTWRWAAVLVPATAALILIVGLGAASLSLQSQITQQQARLERLTQIQAALQQFMLNKNVRTTPVQLAGPATSAMARLYFADSKVAMAVTGLPPLEGDSVYQCWWTNTQTGETVPGTFFKTDANGAGVWVWQIPEGGEYSQMTITQESQPGKTKIEGPVVLKVNL